MYLPDCYLMRFTTLSNYRLIDWLCNVDFRLFTCWFDFKFCWSYFIWETGGLELASTINLVLQTNRLTKCASHPFRRLYITFDGYILLLALPYCDFIRIQDFITVSRTHGLKARLDFNINLLTLIQLCFFCSSMVSSINFNALF